MVAASLYPNYFQKSKTFLFPALGVLKGEHTKDIQTFLEWENRFTVNDFRLTVVKQGKIMDPVYQQFEQFQLLDNVCFENMIYLSNETKAYVFNMEQFQEDWKQFLLAKYSRLSLTLKNRIKQYFNEKSIEWSYVQRFLYPKDFFGVYAELLYDENERAEGLNLIQQVGELCDPYDPAKELYKVIPSKLTSPTLIV